MYTVLQDNPMKIVHCESSKAPLFRVVNNKQLLSAATTVHWTPPFCIALCSGDLFGFVVLARCFVFDFDDDAA